MAGSQPFVVRMVFIRTRRRTEHGGEATGGGDATQGGEVAQGGEARRGTEATNGAAIRMLAVLAARRTVRCVPAATREVER